VNSLDLFVEIVNARMKPAELFITSFYPNLVSALVDFAPQIQRGILTGWAIEDPLKLMESTGARIMLPRFPYADAALVNTLHTHHYSIIVWDCNKKQDLHTALDWGIEGIITDSPDILAQEMTKL